MNAPELAATTLGAMLGSAGAIAALGAAVVAVARPARAEGALQIAAVAAATTLAVTGQALAAGTLALVGGALLPPLATGRRIHERRTSNRRRILGALVAAVVFVALSAGFLLRPPSPEVFDPDVTLSAPAVLAAAAAVALVFVARARGVGR